MPQSRIKSTPIAACFAPGSEDYLGFVHRHFAVGSATVADKYISDLNDPLLEPYRDIRNRNWIENSGIFIAEGPFLLHRLLDSDYACRSLLVDENSVDRYRQLINPTVDVLIAKHELVEQIVGFDFHRGVLSCGLRKNLGSVQRDFPKVMREATAVGIVGVQDPENLGNIVRTSAALGIKNMLLGPGSADPLGRRALRVSMGTALHLNFFRSEHVNEDLAWLRTNRHVDTLAACLEPDAMSIEKYRRNGPVLVLFGNERDGLPTEILAQADSQLRIDMSLNVDSLNVSVAAGILLHYVSRLA